MVVSAVGSCCFLRKSTTNLGPVILLSSLSTDSMEEALIVFGSYLEPWAKKEGDRFTKSFFLNIGDIRTLNWRYTRIEDKALQWIDVDRSLPPSDRYHESMQPALCPLLPSAPPQRWRSLPVSVDRRLETFLAPIQGAGSTNESKIERWEHETNPSACSADATGEPSDGIDCYGGAK